MADIIQWRRDLAANWTAANPVLAQGEAGYELDTSQYKVGDGVTPWNTLPYIGTGDPGEGVPPGGTADQVLAKIDGTDYNTAWVDPPESGVQTVTGGTGITVDNTDPANPNVNADAFAGAGTVGTVPDPGTEQGFVLSDSGDWVAQTGGVSQIVAGQNITIDPAGGTGVVTVNAAASAQQNPPFLP